MFKMVLFVISDDYYGNEEVNVIKRKFIKENNGVSKHSTMKLSHFKDTYGYLSIPFGTSLIVFIIHESEKHECEKITYDHCLALFRDIDYAFIKEEDKEMKNKVNTIDLKKGMDDIIESINALNAIDDECHLNKTTAQYFNKACEYVKTTGVGDKYVYLHTMKFMASQINNLENLLTTYKNKLEDCQKIQIVDSEKLKLQEENKCLKLENEELKNKISQVMELIRGELNG